MLCREDFYTVQIAPNAAQCHSTLFNDTCRTLNVFGPETCPSWAKVISVTFTPECEKARRVAATTWIGRPLASPTQEPDHPMAVRRSASHVQASNYSAVTRADQATEDATMVEMRVHLAAAKEALHDHETRIRDLVRQSPLTV
jgi:hypothetical protein